MVQQRVMETANGRFLLQVKPAAREFLLGEGTDLEYGARHLKRAIERHVVYPLANLLATEQVSPGDLISIDWDGVEAGLKFSKEGEGAAVPAALPFRKTLREAVAASCGARGIVSPQATSVQGPGVATLLGARCCTNES
jgi:hypothetical protein